MKWGGCRDAEIFRMRTADGQGRGNGMIFRKKVLGWSHNSVAEQIQVIGPFVHTDVMARLYIGCESFRGS